ncbi:MAG: hypothetical protein QM608_00165 [Caulobacter sp.]
MTALLRRLLAWPAIFLWPAGRIGRRTFALAAPAVYAAWWLSPFVMVALILWLEGPEGAADTPPWATLSFYPALLALAYVSLCVHRKRLADAGRGAWSFWLLSVASIAALMLLPTLLMTTIPLGADQSLPLDEYGRLPPQPFLVAGAPLLAVLIAWPLYSLWAGLARPRPAPEAPPLAQDQNDPRRPA